MRPLSPPQVATIGSTLSNRSDWRSLALFRLAIDSMLRASDIVRLTIPELVGSNGVVMDEITTRQKKTGDGVRAALSDETREAVARWLGARPENWEEWLFPGKDAKGHLSESQYRRDAKEWFALAHLDTRFYSTHSLRRTKAAFVYSKTGNIEVVRRLLGHKSVEATSKYLGIQDADAIRIAREIKI
jgi:integrase